MLGCANKHNPTFNVLIKYTVCAKFIMEKCVLLDVTQIKPNAKKSEESIIKLFNYLFTIQIVCNIWHSQLYLIEYTYIG